MIRAPSSSDTLERWAFPGRPTLEESFSKIFDYLTQRLGELRGVGGGLAQLQHALCPVSNYMVKPSRLFFRLGHGGELYPFLFEVPRCYGAYDELFRAAGVRDTVTDDANTGALTGLLQELRDEYAGRPFNPTELQTVLRILALVADGGASSADGCLGAVLLPTEGGVLRPAASLYVHDARWLERRIDLSIANMGADVFVRPPPASYLPGLIPSTGTILGSLLLDF